MLTVSLNPLNANPSVKSKSIPCRRVQEVLWHEHTYPTFHNSNDKRSGTGKDKREAFLHPKHKAIER